MKRKIFVLLTVCLILFTFTACGTGKENTDEMHMEKNLRLVINDVEVAVLWEDNEAVTALKKLVSFSSLTVQMSMYGGFEQVGALGASLPRNDKHTTTQIGDIMLYSGSQIVIFYGSNSWAYTRLGKIKDKTEEEIILLLSNENIKITISYGE